MTMNQSTVTVTEDSDRPYGEQSDGCRDRQLRPACLPVLADSPDTTRTCGYWLGRVHTPRVRVGSGRCLTIFARKKIIKYAFMEKNFKFSTSQSTKMCYFRKKKTKNILGTEQCLLPRSLSWWHTLPTLSSSALDLLLCKHNLVPAPTGSLKTQQTFVVVRRIAIERVTQRGGTKSHQRHQLHVEFVDLADVHATSSLVQLQLVIRQLLLCALHVVIQ